MIFTAIREEVRAAVPNKCLVNDGITLVATVLKIHLNTRGNQLIQQIRMMFPAILRILFWTQRK